MGLRRSRYVGLSKVHLGHVLATAELNLLRVVDWFSEKPRAKIRLSPFTRLMYQPVPG